MCVYARIVSKRKCRSAHQRQRQAVLTDGYNVLGADFVHGTSAHQDYSSQEVCQGELHQEGYLVTNTHTHTDRKECCKYKNAVKTQTKQKSFYT